MNNKTYIISLIALIAFMIVGAIFFRKKTYPEITEDSKRIEISVDKKKYRKGFLILNDSITVYGNIKQTPSGKKNKYPDLQLKDISAPYLLVKESGENYLKLIKNDETYFFNLNYD